MAKRRRRRRKDYTLVYALIIAFVVAALTMTIIAVVATNGRFFGAETSSKDKPIQAPTTSVFSAAPTTTTTTSSQIETTTSSQIAENNKGNNRLENGDYIEYTVSGIAELDQWYLKLTNKWKPAGKDFVPESLIRINDEGYMFDSRAYGAYTDMVKAAWADGVNLYPISAYRAYSRQETLYKQRIQRFIDQGLSEEEATEKAGTIVAIPGTSEHQVGLAIDFNSVEQEFENTKEGKWLAENSTEFGFILRYPTDKTELTGIIYEPWHFRFVGVKHAKRMKQLGMCLEEYVDHIKAGNQ